MYLYNQTKEPQVAKCVNIHVPAKSFSRLLSPYEVDVLNTCDEDLSWAQLVATTTEETAAPKKRGRKKAVSSDAEKGKGKK